MESICCSPPESVPACCRMRSRRMGKRPNTYSRSFLISGASRRR
jgi:hypothetical protein